MIDRNLRRILGVSSLRSKNHGDADDESRPFRRRPSQAHAKNVELARRILIDGVPQSPVAQKTGLTRKRINGMVDRVVAAENEVPPGWECVEVWLLPELAGKVREMADEARAGLKGA